MKKLSFLLALVLLVSCFMLASCGSDDAESTDAASEEASVEESVAESSAPAAESTDESETSEPEDISEPETSEPAAPGEPTGDNLALNCTVTGADIPSNPNAQTYSGKLTDGEATDNPKTYDAQWFGYWYNNKPETVAQTNTQNGVGIATVDLGAVKDVKMIRVHIVEGCESGIVTPVSIKYEYSEDGKTYKSAGEKKFAKPDEGVALTTSWQGVELDEAVKAQYVRLSITVGGTWTFLNEIEVY